MRRQKVRKLIKAFKALDAQIEKQDKVIRRLERSITTLRTKYFVPSFNRPRIPVAINRQHRQKTLYLLDLIFRKNQMIARRERARVLLREVVRGL